jgi:Lrp/AsnC family transcriptional regulator, leucine-responsive regulatory protein
MSKSPLSLDATDLRILEELQEDASCSNLELADKVHVSPATCLRRVKRLENEGIIERRVAVLSPDRLLAGLTAVVEISLDQQGSELMDAFERRVIEEEAVQQCYRVASGPDFVLILQVRDMESYHAAAHRLLSADANVRNVRTFFAVKRAKMSTRIALPILEQGGE